MAIQNPVTICGEGSAGNSEPVDVTNGKGHVAVKSKDDEPETWADGNSVTGTGAALYTSGDLTIYGYPYKSVIFTKSAAVESATIVWFVSQGVHGFTLTGLTTETVTLTATNTNNNDIGAVAVKKADGTADDGTGLANGTYYLLRNV